LIIYKVLVMNMPTLLAGAAKKDITPPLGTILGCDLDRHFARFIHDPLYAKALVMRKENMMVAIVIVDICIMPSDLMDDIKERIHDKTGISPGNILLASTHTHGAGDVVGILGSAVDIAYRNSLHGPVVDAVEQAVKNLKPARITSGSTEVTEHLLCRRYLMDKGYMAHNPVTGEADLVKTNPFGAENLIVDHASPVDPGVGFLAVKGTDNRWIALLGNYSMHYVGDWHVDTVTADYYGEFSRQVQDKLDAGEDFVGMMTYGTGADVNIWEFRHPERYPVEQFAKTKLIGRDLAERVVSRLKEVTWQENPELEVRFEELQLAVRKPSAKELELARRRFTEKGLDNLTGDQDTVDRIYAREVLLVNQYPDTCSSSVQAIRIGDQVIGALGGEFFSETGLRLKKGIKGYNYFSICLANSYGGYVPPAHEMERGGYETWLARSSFLEEGAEKKIRSKMLELVGRLG
jgi:hypothetical protein